MKIAITGATGFIGRRLVDLLSDEGDELCAITRNEERASALLPGGTTIVRWHNEESGDWLDAAAECEAVVNLAGENLSSGRWTPRKKGELLESRLAALRSVGALLKRRAGRKTTLIQASAIGYYGPRGDELLGEDSAAGTGFLSEIARACEEAAARFASPTVRVVAIRSGIVLGPEAGIVPRLFGPLRTGAGGYPGRGTQWLSWIHIVDEVAAIRFLLKNPALEGVFNVTAPEPVTMKQFVKLGGEALHRPVWIPLPGFLLRIAFGEMADEALLTGQRVAPVRLREAGFVFRYPTAKEAIDALYTGG